MMINVWNFFSDMAKALNEEFIGDSDQEQILEIYEKMFYGCNLKAINQGKEEYHPNFDESERNKMIQFFRNGFSTLDKQLGQKGKNDD